MMPNTYLELKMKTLSDLGEEFSSLRKQGHKTQGEVASVTGMRQEALSRFERGRGNDFSLGKFLRMAQALGYDVQLVPAKKHPTLTDVLEQRKQAQNVGPESR